MTLRELLILLNLRIKYPRILANIKITNLTYQSPISLYKYLRSKKFHDDMAIAAFDVHVYMDHGCEHFVLKFIDEAIAGKKEKALMVFKNPCVDSFIDSFDNYQ